MSVCIPRCTLSVRVQAWAWQMGLRVRCIEWIPLCSLSVIPKDPSLTVTVTAPFLCKHTRKVRKYEGPQGEALVFYGTQWLNWMRKSLSCPTSQQWGMGLQRPLCVELHLSSLFPWHFQGGEAEQWAFVRLSDIYRSIESRIKNTTCGNRAGTLTQHFSNFSCIRIAWRTCENRFLGPTPETLIYQV